jgi:hypothetical protein
MSITYGTLTLQKSCVDGSGAFALAIASPLENRWINFCFLTVKNRSNLTDNVFVGNAHPNGLI